MQFKLRNGACTAIGALAIMCLVANVVVSEQPVECGFCSGCIYVRYICEDGVPGPGATDGQFGVWHSNLYAYSGLYDVVGSNNLTPFESNLITHIKMGCDCNGTCDLGYTSGSIVNGTCDDEFDVQRWLCPPGGG